MASRELQTLLTVFRTRPPRRADAAAVPKMRAEFEAFSAVLRPPAGLTAVAVEIPPAHPGGARLAAEWVTVAGAPEDLTLLFFHGGGYASGSLATHRSLVGRLAAACGARALHVAYRLAPEFPFPAAFEDALSACRFLRNQGVAPDAWVLGGDSAGGGLAVAAAAALRDAGEPLPAALFALSPWTDLAVRGASVDGRAHLDPLFDRASLESMAGLYRGAEAAEHPAISPLYADLRGLPPVLLQVGSSEVLHDDTTRLAERWTAAGGAVELEVWEDMFHGWQMFSGMLPEADEAIAQVGAFVARVTLGLARRQVAV